MARTRSTESPLTRFLAELRPLLAQQGASVAYVFGSWARGDADRYSDIDIIVVAPSNHPAVDQFKDYLPAIASAGIGVDMFVYTPEEFEEIKAEARPFLMHVLAGSELVHEG